MGSIVETVLSLHVCLTRIGLMAIPRIMSHMAHFLKEGFMCLDVNISIPEIPVNSIRLMKYFESGSSRRHARVIDLLKAIEELVAALQEAQTTFPPVIFARQCAGLISQTYISSHPATAMILLSPPPSNADVSILKSPLPEFNFEPLFPIALVAETADMQALKERSRLARDPGVDTFTVSSLESESTAVKLSSWLDELGV